MRIEVMAPTYHVNWAPLSWWYVRWYLKRLLWACWLTIRPRNHFPRLLFRIVRDE